MSVSITHSSSHVKMAPKHTTIVPLPHRALQCPTPSPTQVRWPQGPFPTGLMEAHWQQSRKSCASLGVGTSMFCATLPSGKPASIVSFSSDVPCGARSSGHVDEGAASSFFDVRTGREVSPAPGDGGGAMEGCDCLGCVSVVVTTSVNGHGRARVIAASRGGSMTLEVGMLRVLV